MEILKLTPTNKPESEIGPTWPLLVLEVNIENNNGEKLFLHHVEKLSHTQPFWYKQLKTFVNTNINGVINNRVLNELLLLNITTLSKFVSNPPPGIYTINNLTIKEGGRYLGDRSRAGPSCSWPQCSIRMNFRDKFLELAKRNQLYEFDGTKWREYSD